MIKISVVSYNNEASAQTLSAIFDQKGGTLGRSDDNYFVLPDPKRYVSRLQASVRSDGTRHKIVNLSQANPILINGQEIDSGQEYDLNAGDEIQIGLYLLRAELHDGVGEERGARARTSNGGATQSTSSTIDLKTRLTAQTSIDPFDSGLSDVAELGLDPFADLLGPLVSPVIDVPRKLASPAHNAVLSEPGSPVIPDDFDPFALPSQSLRNTSDPLADLSSNEITLESLKNGKADLNNLMSPALDSHGGSLLDAPNFGLNDFSEVDPLALFSSDSMLMTKPDNEGSVGPVVSNHVPEVNAHFMMPQVSPAVSHEDTVASSGMVDDRVLSAPALVNATSDSGLLHKEADINGPYIPNNAVELAPEKSVASEPTALPLILDEHPVPMKNANSADSHELMQAFLRGADIPPNAIFSSVTPELMEMFGKLLATSIQGTVELIASRALVKREVQADMTMIVAKKNNPLKFLPDGQTVLMQMLREKMPGFMEPVEAMQDAYEDLRAHQIGVVAGMRAAMTEVLERFNPELLEKKLKDHSFIDSVLPLNRKAKMWDQYTELFQEIRLKAQDDFQALFGKTFVAAYEVEIERFKNRGQDD